MGTKWKTFRFFEREIIKDPDADSALLDLQALDITCATAGSGFIIVGDNDGYIHMFDQQFRVRRFRPFSARVNQVMHLRQSSILITVGDGPDSRPAQERQYSASVARTVRPVLQEVVRRKAEEAAAAAAAAAGGVPGAAGAAAAAGGERTERTAPDWSARTDMTLGTSIMLWRMDKLDAQGLPLRVVELALEDRLARLPVTSLAATEQLTWLTLGFSDGSVLLLSSKNLLRQRPHPFLLSAPPTPAQPRVPDDGAQMAVTGLAIVEAGEGRADDTLFVAHRCALYSYPLPPPGTRLRSRPPGNELDDRGCDRHCATATSDGHMALGQDDAVFFFTTEFRGQAYAFDKPYHYLAAVQECVTLPPPLPPPLLTPPPAVTLW